MTKLDWKEMWGIEVDPFPPEKPPQQTAGFFIPMPLMVYEVECGVNGQWVLAPEPNCFETQHDASFRQWVLNNGNMRRYETRIVYRDKTPGRNLIGDSTVSKEWEQGVSGDGW